MANFVGKKNGEDQEITTSMVWPKGIIVTDKNTDLIWETGGCVRCKPWPPALITMTHDDDNLLLSSSSSCVHILMTPHSFCLLIPLWFVNGIFIWHLLSGYSIQMWNKMACLATEVCLTCSILYRMISKTIDNCW